VSRLRGGGDGTDVAIIGAGPAGSTIARLLASWGWSVTVIDRRRTRPSLAESLPPSTRKLLAFLGQLEAIDAARFHSNRGNVVQWAGQSRVTHTDASGLHVRRADFDRILRESAGRSGARLCDGIVSDVRIEDAASITFVTGGKAETCRARYVVDCSGRAGVVARRGLRVPEPRYRTLAIAADWTSIGWDANEREHTIVESYGDGWAWSVPLSATRRQFTVMIDHDLRHKRRGSRAAPAALNAVYARELARTDALASRLAGARQTCAAWACDASLYRCSRAADGPALLVGDAASFIEPLSAAGVKKALASAWRAAVVVNTCLAKPAMAAAATEFYTAREAEVEADCRRRSAGFFTEAFAAYDQPFWAARAASVRDVGRGTSDEEPLVRAAFERLRQAASVRLRVSDAVRFAAAAEIDGREVVLREGLVLPGARRPVRFAAGIDLRALVRLAPRCDQVGSLIASYQAEVGPAPVDGVLTGLSYLVAKRALVTDVSETPWGSCP